MKVRKRSVPDIDSLAFQIDRLLFLFFIAREIGGTMRDNRAVINKPIVTGLSKTRTGFLMTVSSLV
ncbi:hypothetical protein PO124_22735 [Bacillus licheniformis]|nr:hypothetical protein [Bacillus licheniformis]